MTTELRFLFAIALMVGVLVVTNVLFPPIASESPAGPATDSVAPGAGTPSPTATSGAEPSVAGEVSAVPTSIDTTVAIGEPSPPERSVVVESALYRHVFSTRGARIVSTELQQFNSFTRDGVVQLVPDGQGALGLRLVVGGDTVDLRKLHFEPSVERLQVPESGSSSLTFRHQGSQLSVEVTYHFSADTYVIEAAGEILGAERALVLADLGVGLPLNDADTVAEGRALAYVGNHLREGIDSYPLRDVDQPSVHQGPYLWVAFKNKFFVLAMLPQSEEPERQYFGGILVAPEGPGRARVAVASEIAGDGQFGYGIFMGPQDYGTLTVLGDDLEEVNPYGWRIFRPIIRPFVGLITWVLMFLHESLNLAYGWVLVVFGVLMRIVLWPLNQKAMRAQMRNMAVQPLLKEIQTKHKDNPERLQKEMLRLYREHGFNPMAGCLPMLLPWPVLIALFFVFQNTIELRGASFLWLPDLSAPDPLYVLPIFMGISMFFLQWMGMRSMQEINQQMKVMMWMMPVLMVIIFFRLAAGLNLYYAVSNLATIPQQYWIAKERARAQAQGPVKITKG